MSRLHWQEPGAMHLRIFLANNILIWFCSYTNCTCTQKFYRKRRQNLIFFCKLFPQRGNTKLWISAVSSITTPMWDFLSCWANDGLASQQIMTVWVASAKPQLVTFCLLMMGVHIRRACKQKGVFNSLLLKSWSILICMAVAVLCRKLFAKLSVVCSSASRS